jgi:hypothetical protein
MAQQQSLSAYHTKSFVERWIVDYSITAGLRASADLFFLFLLLLFDI